MYTLQYTDTHTHVRSAQYLKHIVLRDKNAAELINNIELYVFGKRMASMQTRGFIHHQPIIIIFIGKQH